MTILKVLHLTISPSIRTGVFPRLKNGSDRMEGVSFKNGACFLCGRPRIKPGGGAGFAINGLSPTNSFDEKGSGTPRDDILTKLLCSCQRRMFHVHRQRNFDRWHLNWIVTWFFGGSFVELVRSELWRDSTLPWDINGSCLNTASLDFSL